MCKDSTYLLFFLLLCHSLWSIMAHKMLKLMLTLSLNCARLVLAVLVLLIAKAICAFKYDKDEVFDSAVKIS